MTENNKKVLFTNGKVFGGSRWNEPVWFETVFVENGIIKNLGNYDELKDRVQQRDIIDLNGCVLLPGLCDAHLHMAAGGGFLELVDLGGMDRNQTKKALLAADKGRRGKEWITALNWDADNCELNARILDKWLPNRKILIFRRDIHSCCCSLAALKAANITRNTQAPEFGTIGRDAEGNPNGILYEKAIGLVSGLIPEPDRNDIRRHILNAQKHFLKSGLTAVSECLNDGAEDIFWELDAGGELILDIDAWLRIDAWDGVSRPPAPERRFRLNTIKLFLDGTFGSRTAALLQPYENSESCGSLQYEDLELRDILNNITAKGWRAAMHAIGDRAVDQALRICAEVSKPDKGGHRIEHIQMLPPEYLRKAKKADIIASVQPVHLLDDRKWLHKRIGFDRCQHVFRWNSLLKNKIPLALGSDFPVASPDPLQNIHIAINRAGFGEKPNEEFDAAEALDPVSAIRAASYGWAVAAALEDERGAIHPGRTADFTVIDGLDEGMRDWSNASAEMTVCDGEVCCRRGDF